VPLLEEGAEGVHGVVGKKQGSHRIEQIFVLV